MKTEYRLYFSYTRDRWADWEHTLAFETLHEASAKLVSLREEARKEGRDFQASIVRAVLSEEGGVTYCEDFRVAEPFPRDSTWGSPKSIKMIREKKG